MPRKWIGGAATVEVNDATGALLVEGANAAPAPGQSSLSTVAASISEVALMPANASRKGLVLHNASSSALYVRLGTGASQSAYTYKVFPEAHLELPQPAYTGDISGIWDSADGSALVTELY